MPSDVVHRPRQHHLSMGRRAPLSDARTRAGATESPALHRTFFFSSSTSLCFCRRCTSPSDLFVEEGQAVSSGRRRARRAGPDLEGRLLLDAEPDADHVTAARASQPARLGCCRPRWLLAPLRQWWAAGGGVAGRGGTAGRASSAFPRVCCSTAHTPTDRALPHSLSHGCSTRLLDYSFAWSEALQSFLFAPQWTIPK